MDSWVRDICQRELEQAVVIHDDQSQPGMYDFRVGPIGAPAIAIECVRAMDATLEELWNVGPRRGALKLGVTGDWIGTLTREARFKKLVGLETTLRDCEETGLWNVHVDWRLKRSHPHTFMAFERLGIAWASCVREHGTGKVSLTLDERGGVVDEEGRAVPGWIGEFLRSEAQVDVLSKLSRSNATARHAFVPVGWGGAPWPVESYLTSGVDMLPARPPDLPEPVGSVWIVSMHATHGIRWDGERWRKFEARIDSVAA